jgi:hypothetical protein
MLLVDDNSVFVRVWVVANDSLSPARLRIHNAETHLAPHSLLQPKQQDEVSPGLFLVSFPF